MLGSLRQAGRFGRRSRRHRPRSGDAHALLYELVDAHADTMRLIDEGAAEEAWRLHRDYLRDLQRVTREALARTAEPDPAEGADDPRRSLPGVDAG